MYNKMSNTQPENNTDYELRCKELEEELLQLKEHKETEEEEGLILAFEEELSKHYDLQMEVQALNKGLYALPARIYDRYNDLMSYTQVLFDYVFDSEESEEEEEESKEEKRETFSDISLSKEEKLFKLFQDWKKKDPDSYPRPHYRESDDYHYSEKSS